MTGLLTPPPIQVVALMQLHQRGIMHRDIKPENIFIADSGKWLIGDFGLALIEERGALRDLTSDEKVGTEHYLAPEQVKGLTYTGAVDVWQLGCVLIELLRGSRGWPNPWKTTLTDRRGYSLNMVTASLEDIEDAVQRSLYSIIPDPDELGMLLPVGHHRKQRLVHSVANHVAQMVRVNPAERPDSQKLIWQEWFKSTQPADVLIGKQPYKCESAVPSAPLQTLIVAFSVTVIPNYAPVKTDLESTSSQWSNVPMMGQNALLMACEQPTEAVEADIEKLRNFCFQQREYHVDPAAFEFPQ